jgi:hypothetical protein
MFKDGTDRLNRVQECVPVIRARQNFEATTLRLQKEADVKNLIDEYVSFLSFLLRSRDNPRSQLRRQPQSSDSRLELSWCRPSLRLLDQSLGPS